MREEIGSQYNDHYFLWRQRENIKYESSESYKKAGLFFSAKEKEAGIITVAILLARNGW